MWAPKVAAIFGAAYVAAAAVLAVAGVTQASRHSAILQAGRQQYQLQVAATPPAQEKGLGGIAALPSDKGMLFVFPAPALRCFWMKNMHFPLDIIWLDSRKNVVHVEYAVSPRTYPHAFCPNVPAQYVIELNAGEAAHAGILAGQNLSF